MKEDYKGEEVVGFLWLWLMIFLIFGRIIGGILGGEEWWQCLGFWEMNRVNPGGGLAAMVVSGWWFCRVKDWKLWPLLESGALAVGVLMAGFWGQGWRREWREMIVVLAVMILAVGAGKGYRRFVWYRSGKKGFLWWWLNGFGWLGWGISSYFFGKNTVNLVIGVVLGLLSAGGLFILGEIWPKK